MKVVCRGALIAALAYGSAQAQELKKLTVVLSYVPNVEAYGPEYALHNGFFREQGLDVTRAPAGQGVDQVQMVASGAADIGITDPETILAGVARGEKFVAFAAEFQKSPVAMTCRKDSRVAKPADLKGRNWASRPAQNRSPTCFWRRMASNNRT